MITAKVVNPFMELQHDGYMYKAGDMYPAKGFEAIKERVLFLAAVHPRYKKIYLANVEAKEPIVDEPNPETKANTKLPKHTGGGGYELSNGEKIQGKEEAIEAEQALKSGE